MCQDSYQRHLTTRRSSESKNCKKNNFFSGIALTSSLVGLAHWGCPYLLSFVSSLSVSHIQAAFYQFSSHGAYPKVYSISCLGSGTAHVSMQLPKAHPNVHTGKLLSILVVRSIKCITERALVGRSVIDYSHVLFPCLVTSERCITIPT